jgi:hypothetical protein
MNVLVDASVWIDHLHRWDTGLVALLQASEVVMHPACGSSTADRRKAAMRKRSWLGRRPAYRFDPIVACQTLDASSAHLPWSRSLNGARVVIGISSYVISFAATSGSVSNSAFAFSTDSTLMRNIGPAFSRNQNCSMQ